MQLTCAAAAIGAALLASGAGCGIFDDGGDGARDGGLPDARLYDAFGLDVDDIPVCERVISCPPAAPNKVTMCGQLVDAEDDLGVGHVGGSGASCPTLGDGEGPCSLEIALYDAVQFANGPLTAPVLLPEALSIDDCGRFRIQNIPLPGTGFLAIAVDDSAASGNADYVLSGMGFPVSSGLRRDDVVAYAVRTATDQQWTSDALDPFGGATFSEVGVYMPTFLYENTPVAGVSIAGTEDYYFSDTADTRHSIDPVLTATGANGTGLFVNGGLFGNPSGGEPADCSWASDLGAAIAGVVLANQVHATGGSCD